jgi:tetratricopeptide (TPR) repeat protein
MSSFRYKQPADENAFVEFCLVLFREVWDLPDLVTYAHRGEGQYGVDLIDTSGKTPLTVFQCKHRKTDKTLAPKEIDEEVEKALGFPEPIGKYVILTTAKKSARSQDKVIKLNIAHREKGSFTIQLFTWDDIELLIDDSLKAQQFLGVKPSDGVVRVIENSIVSIGVTLQHQAGDLKTAELDEAKSYLDQGEPQVALILVRRLRHRSWAELTPAQQARLRTLEAAALLRVGDNKEAAKLLIEVRTYTPDDERTMLNEVNGWYILGEFDKAKTTAEEARARFPRSAGAYGACIELADSTEEAKSLVESVPTEMLDTPEILIAIAARGDLGEPAEDAARRGTETSPDDARMWFALGDLMLDAEQQKANPALPGPPQPLSSTKLNEAKDAFSKVIEISTRTGHVGLQVTALLRRIVISGLLRDLPAVRDDTERVFLLAPDDLSVLTTVAGNARERGDLETAVDTLRRALMIRGSDEVKFFLAVALWDRNGLGDREEANLLMADVAYGGGPNRELYLLLGNQTEAMGVLDKVDNTFDPILTGTLRALIAINRSEAAEATTLAEDAFDSVTESTPRNTIKTLAKTFVSLNRYTEGFNLLQGIAVPGMDEETDRLLIRCAWELKRHKFILDYGKKARETGFFDGYLLEHELRLLDQYDPPTALGILTELVFREPENHRARVNLIRIALRLGQRGLAEEHVKFLPYVVDVDTYEGLMVVSILHEFGQVSAALKFAYDLLRLHFDDHMAHRAFRDAMLWADRERERFDTPTSVIPGVAVYLSEEGILENRWVVVEDSPVEVRDFEDEVRAESSLGRLLLGKNVGDEVVLSEEIGVRRTAIVKEILPKYIYRFRDVLNRWQYRFPDEKELWMIRVGGENGKYDFRQIYEVAEHRRERTEEVEKLYKTQLIPVGTFTNLLGGDEIRAVSHIASSENLPVRCCIGPEEELREALNAFSSASEVVVELTGFATLMMLDELKRLDMLSKKFLVSHSTMFAIRALSREPMTDKRWMGSLEITPNGPKFIEPTDEYREATTVFFETVVRFAEERFISVTASELPGMDPDDREKLSVALGQPAFESIAIASHPDRILWTDDGVLTSIIRDYFTVPHIWTQAGLGWMVNEGLIDSDVFNQASAKLIGWGYTFSRANRAIFQTAGAMTEWEPDAWPLKQVIAYLGLPEVNINDVIPLGACLIADAYAGVALPVIRSGILIRILETIAGHNDFTERAFDDFSRILPHVLGLTF